MGRQVNNYQRIWRTVQAIPEGRVASYGQIADLAGLPRRARLVGRALGEVPDDLTVPWHRCLEVTGGSPSRPAQHRLNDRNSGYRRRTWWC